MAGVDQKDICASKRWPRSSRGLQIVRLILALPELWFTALAGVFNAPGLWPLVPGSHLFDAVCC